MGRFILRTIFTMTRVNEWMERRFWVLFVVGIYAAGFLILLDR